MTASDDDEISFTLMSTGDVSSSFYLGDNRGSGGAAIHAFTEPISDRNLCVGPLYIGANGEYAGGVLTQADGGLVRGEWVQLRLSVPSARSSVGLAFRPGQGAGRFAVLGSQDGSSFTELMRADADVWPLGRLVLFPLNNHTAYRFYRVLLLQGQAGCGGYLCVHRIEFFD